MRHFLRLSNLVINTSKIVKIKTFPNQYHIYLNETNFSGHFYIFFGNIASHDNCISIYKDNNIEDFNIVSKWISNIDFKKNSIA
jgi:hypothetical protein